MPKFRHLALILVICAVPTLAQALSIDALLGESWYGLYLNGQKAGYAVNATEKNEDGGVIVTEEAQFRITMNRVKQDMQIKTTRVYGPKGDLVRVQSLVEDVAGPKRFEGVVEGDSLILETTISGQTSRQVLPKPQESLRDSLQQLELIQNGRLGGEITFSVFEPMYQRELTGVSRLSGVEERVLDGVLTKVYEIKTAMELLGVETVSYVTADGATLEDQVGGILTMRLEPEEMAKNVDYTNDVIIANAAYIDEPIENARLRESLRLKINGPFQKSHLFNDARQQFTKTNGAYEFHGKAIDLSGVDVVQIPVTDPKFQKWLEPTVYVQSAHPDMVAKAEEIIGEETNALEAAERLTRWVYRNVQTTFSARLTNALEVLREPEGDCTEHSILFIGLARAAGLPAREVAGLIYVSSPQPGFYFHQWAKVWVGEWIDVDPTFNQVLADATHIKLSEGDLFEQAKLVPIIGQIDIAVLE